MTTGQAYDIIVCIIQKGPAPCMRCLPKESGQFKTSFATGGKPSEDCGNNIDVVNFWHCQLWEHAILSDLKVCLEREFLCFEILHIVRIYQYVSCCTDLNLHNSNYN